jgi:hypothetical protein
MNNAEKYSALIKSTQVFQLAQLEAMHAREVAKFDEVCIQHGNCTDEAAEGALPGIRHLLKDIALVATFQRSDQAATARALTSYVTISWLHFRSLRSRFRREESSEFYAIGMEDFASAACAGMILGLQVEGQWLASEFLRHFDANYDDPYSADTNYLEFCAWLLRQASDQGPRVIDAPSGFYAPLVEASAADWESRASHLLDARLDYSHRSIVRHENLAPKHCQLLFAALFPIEMLAYVRLSEGKWKLKSTVAGDHVLLSPLKTLKSVRDQAMVDFFSAADRRLQGLERAVGL